MFYAKQKPRIIKFERLLWFGSNFLISLEKKIHINELAYKRQRNICTKPIKKTKRNFYNNLNVNGFTEKTLKDEKIVLVENDTAFSEENEVADVFRSYFDGIVDGLNIKRCEISKEDSDPILNAIKTFEKHPSILKIKELSFGCRFSFENVSLEDVKKVTRELDISKTSQVLDIPTKIIEQNADIFSEFFFVNINHSINNSTFPEELKWADVKPVFKKNSRNVKETTGRLAFCLISPKFMRDVCIHNFMIILM